MAASESLADTLYDAFEARLETSPLVASAPVVALIRKDSGSPEDLTRQATAAAGNAGVCIFLSRPRLAPLPASPWYVGSFLVEIAEEPTLNRGVGGTLKTAASLEEDIVPHLVTWSHALGIGPLYVQDADVPEEGGGNLRQITFGFGALLRVS